ncbi:hypothetical protein Nepgr_011309 [Nepenthes gracilis]|uniref:TPX2 central domain-containing protein n=1 Tax=Nepenthes gracilis TaxID=150966 RepID=A0AAD3SDZ1_NEPGR|nr:hypothetical protein Nepgr_011309 [Nepenthes gracilis]
MDEEMEEGGVQVFEVVEIDLDYEFDAAGWFDFSRKETEAEARDAESWFDSAESYPPSPFVAKLFWRKDVFSDNVNTFSMSKYADMTLLDGDSNVAEEELTEKAWPHKELKGMDQTILEDIQSGYAPDVQSDEQGLIAASCKGFAFCDDSMDETRKVKTRSVAKPSLQRNSTLMKPTVSQLAKQNPRCQAGDPRFQKLPVQKNESGSNYHSGVEIQASKRQKLDGGYLHKAGELKHQSNLIHKVPKKDETICGMVSHIKLKLTIPREPELETACRAQRLRSTNSEDAEKATTTTCEFKARPFNKKIFEAPVLPLPKSTPKLPAFQVFRLKTLDRAMQHTTTITSSSSCQTDKCFNRASAKPNVKNGKKDCKRSDSVHLPKQEEQRVVNGFKARPLDKRIFTSKGDIGVLKNIKREITRPKEFNLQTQKRNQQNPPVELFSKLSLASEIHPISTQLNLPRPTCLHVKGSKENRCGPFQQDHNIKHLEKERSQKFYVKQTQCNGDGESSRIGPQPSMNRIFGIW